MLGNELMYELVIRDVVVKGRVAENRSLLRKILGIERSGAVLSLVSLGPKQELSVCTAKLDDYLGSIQEFDTKNAENGYKRLKSRALHLVNRIKTISPINPDIGRRKDSLPEIATAAVETLEDAYKITHLYYIS